jgi:hypothetical protein
MHNVFVPLLQIVSAGAVAASPPWLDAITNNFDFRWCVTALVAAGVLPAWIKHFDLQLHDMLYDVSAKLYGDGERVLPGHVRTRAQPITVRHGMHFAFQHLKQQAHVGVDDTAEQGGARPAGESSAKWTARQLGFPAPLRSCWTADDVQHVFQQSSDMSAAAFFHEPATLSMLALTSGVLMLPSRAARFAHDVTLRTVAWELLSKARYEELQRRLRDAPLQGPPAASALSNVRPAPPSQRFEAGAMALPATFVTGPVLPPVHLACAADVSVATAAAAAATAAAATAAAATAAAATAAAATAAAVAAAGMATTAELLPAATPPAPAAPSTVHPPAPMAASTPAAAAAAATGMLAAMSPASECAPLSPRTKKRRSDAARKAKSRRSQPAPTDEEREKIREKARETKRQQRKRVAEAQQQSRSQVPPTDTP